MQHMFQSSSVKSLDLSNFDTSNVTNMTYMFCGCTSLKSLDLSNFNTSNVRDMTYMFQSSSLQSLDLSNFDTSKVTNMQYMFGFCSSLKSLDLSNFNTSKVTNMYVMLGDCSSLESLNLFSFDTSKVTNMDAMFEGCSSLKSLDLSNFNTSKLDSMDGIFSSSPSIEYINLLNYYGYDIFESIEINENLIIDMRKYSQIISEGECYFKRNNVTIRFYIMYNIYYCSCICKNLNLGIETNNQIIEFEKETDKSCVWNSYINKDYLSQFRYIIYNKPRDIYIILKYSQYISYNDEELNKLINSKSLSEFQNECALKRLDDSNSLLIID